ncbi:MAG TPA: antibiotic biosynthesis monooxygenase [Acidimicrobiales bacterium]|jgi:hypothetical protein
MHAVVVQVEITAGRTDEATQMLLDVVVPSSRQAPGFHAGFWMRSDDGTHGASLEVFESANEARAFIDSLGEMPEGSPVRIASAEVMEVVANA